MIGEDDDLHALINAEIISQLVNNKLVSIGNEIPGMSSLDSAFANIFKEVNVNTLCKELQDSKNIFVIGNMKVQNKKEQIFRYLGVRLCTSLIIEADDYYNKKAIDKRIFLTVDDDDDNFKKFCQQNPHKIIYSINFKDEGYRSFLWLKQIYNRDFYITRKFKGIIIDEEKLGKMHKKYNTEKVIIENDDVPNQVFNCNYLLNNAENTYKNLCQPGNFVHWLKKEKEKIIWKDSYGKITNLRDCVSEELFEEEVFVKPFNRFKSSIICR